MDKLSQFYIELSTDAAKLALFNHGASESEIADNRQNMLTAAGIEHGGDIIFLSQLQLQQLMAKHLGKQREQWGSLKNQAANTTNTDNNVSPIGLSRQH